MFAYVWSAVFFALIVGFAWAARTDDYQRRAWQRSAARFYAQVERRCFLPQAIAAWFALRLFWSLGVALALELVALAVLMLFLANQSKREKRRRGINDTNLLRDPELLKRLAGAELPAWVTFPSVARAEWLNTIIGGMWTEIAASTESSLRSSLNQTLASFRPPFLTRLEMGRVRLGSVPITVTGVEAFSEGIETIIDLHVQWEGNPEIHIIAAMSPLVEVATTVSNLHLRTVVRIILGPHVRKWPCFAALSVSLVGKPELDFDLKAAKLSVDVIPGLSSWLDEFLRSTLTGLMVHPRRITIPMIPEFDPAAYATESDALGTLYVTIVKCHGLPKHILMTPNVVCNVGFVGQKRAFKTPQVTSCDPEFNTTFRFTVYDRNAQLKLAVHHQPTYNAVTKTLRMTEDPLIGYKILYVSTLIDEPFKGTEPLMNVEKVVAGAAITIKTVFQPFRTTKVVGANTDGVEVPSTPSERDSTGSRAPPKSVPTRSAAGLAICTNGKAPAIPVPSPRSRLDETFKKMGTLFVVVDRCNNLKNTETIGRADPYVQLRIGGESARTPVIESCLDPVYGSSLELQVLDAARDVLTVEVRDWERLGEDKLMGSLTIPIAEIERSGNRLKQTWALKPQGKITMELRLLLQ